MSLNYKGQNLFIDNISIKGIAIKILHLLFIFLQKN